MSREMMEFIDELYGPSYLEHSKLGDKIWDVAEKVLDRATKVDPKKVDKSYKIKRGYKPSTSSTVQNKKITINYVGKNFKSAAEARNRAIAMAVEKQKSYRDAGASVGVVVNVRGMYAIIPKENIAEELSFEIVAANGKGTVRKESFTGKKRGVNN